MTVQLRERINEIYKEYPYPLPMPEHYLTDGEVIRFGNYELRVVHTPGHTPGSVLFFCEMASPLLATRCSIKALVGRICREGIRKN